MIREAKEVDPDLARASVVLVTDGEAPVDAASVVMVTNPLADAHAAAGLAGVASAFFASAFFAAAPPVRPAENEEE